MGEYKKRSKPTVVATSEFGKLPPQANPPRGIKNGNSKLTEEDVIYIRNTRYKVSRKDLAAKFNISLKHVDKVRSKERWKHT